MNKSEKQIIIDTYLIVLNDYFTKFLDSEICTYDNSYFGENINYNEQMNYCLYIGIRIIYRVFEYVFQKTKNISNTYYNTNLALSYYLEYMEQIFKSNLLYNFNYSDAILFVYKKTIFEIYDGESLNHIESGSKVIISNIIKFDEDANIDISNEDFNTLFSNIEKITDILLCWKHKFLEKNIISDEVSNPSYFLRIQFFQYFAEKYYKNIDKIINIIDYILIIYQTFDINIICWKMFLEEINIEINKKKIKIFNKKEDFITNFNAEKYEFKEKLYNGTYDDVKLLTKWFFM